MGAGQCVCPDIPLWTLVVVEVEAETPLMDHFVGTDGGTYDR